MANMIKIKRVAAYMLDSLAISTVGWLISYIMKVPELRLFSAQHIMLMSLSIVISFGYYIYFWHKSSFQATLGQLACTLKVSERPTIKQCLKRMVFMHIGGIFFCSVLTYVKIFKAEEQIQYNFLLFTMLSTVAMNLIYAIFIRRVDEVTGIRIKAANKCGNI